MNIDLIKKDKQEIEVGDLVADKFDDLYLICEINEKRYVIGDNKSFKKEDIEFPIILLDINTMSEFDAYISLEGIQNDYILVEKGYNLTITNK